MSKANFLGYISSSSTSTSTLAISILSDERKAVSSEDRRDRSKGNGRSGWERGGREDMGGDTVNSRVLFVGVCIFRLDRETLQPAVLLIRRREPKSPGCCAFATTKTRAATGCEEAGRQKEKQRRKNRRQTHVVGEWELPGGRVVDDDFCISAAVDRLVRRMLGLKVTKIMVMLSSMEWSYEDRVSGWRRGGRDGDGEESEGSESDDDKGFGSSTDCIDSGSGDGDVDEMSEGDKGQTQSTSQVSASGHGGWNRDSTSVSGSVYSTDERIGRAESEWDPNERVTLNTGMPENYQSSPPSSPWTLVRPLSSSDPDLRFDSTSIPPPLPPRHRGRGGHGYIQEHTNEHGNSNINNRNNHKINSKKNNHYNKNRNNSVATYLYDSGSDHDPSLEPAPLCVPRKPVAGAARTITTTETIPLRAEKEKKGNEKEGEIIDNPSPFRTRGRSNTASSTTLSLYDDFNPGSETTRTRSKSKSKSRSRGGLKRNAQMIPHDVVRKTCMQLNFGVIVDEDSDGGGGFLGERRDDDDGYGEDDDDHNGKKKKRAENGGEEKGERKSQERAGAGVQRIKGVDDGDFGGDMREREERKKRGRGREGNGSGSGGGNDFFSFEWATCARVREMNMSEDLRTVVLEGLGWMAELNGQFF
ncbi:hypothetical protein F5B22DRAFT_657659 [Xylaria bambusicola]|uniref:uncharacterized protein n=1 Tax=Xylaria bambusicola TaxID=326684 RepID=UPI002007F608|nr:uncharacterized protein F5B22DRAFT_657659 [Xylaria bambusicola]KAI0512823.1 hypothetical protein F5B22DRAFT_657659 [Xylaria bambusicola]